MAVSVKCFTPFQTNSYLQNMKPSVVSKPWNHLGSDKDILTPCEVPQLILIIKNIIQP